MPPACVPSLPRNLCRRSMVVAPSRARPVWLVTRPIRFPLSNANPSARSTSIPASVVGTAGVEAGTGPDGPKSAPVDDDARATGEGGCMTAAAATVATRPRSCVTSPFPSGCTRLERKTTNNSLPGSSHSDVPVNPVWPNDPTGISSPRFDEKEESMSHPSPRAFRSSAGVARDVILATASGERMRTPRCAPPPRIILQKIARSAAVLKSPAWPATPPIRLAVGS